MAEVIFVIAVVGTITLFFPEQFLESVVKLSESTVKKAVDDTAAEDMASRHVGFSDDEGEVGKEPEIFNLLVVSLSTFHPQIFIQKVIFRHGPTCFLNAIARKNGCQEIRYYYLLARQVEKLFESFYQMSKYMKFRNEISLHSPRLKIEIGHLH